MTGLHHLPSHVVFRQLEHLTKRCVKKKFNADIKHTNLQTLFEIHPSPQVIKVCLPNFHIVGGLNEASTQSFLEGHWS